MAKDSHAKREGREAAYMGRSRLLCPYSDAVKATAWKAGYEEGLRWRRQNNKGGEARK